MQYEYLYDDEFLKEIDELPLQTSYVRIHSLDRFDAPIASLEGIVTAGNININGNSAMRRTGSLTMVVEGFQYSLTDIRNIIAIDKRISLEVGIQNTTSKYSDYPIIWFPLGIYLIGSPSINYGISNYTISLNLKDKMALLDGSVGGTISAMTTFSPVETEINGEKENEPIKIYDLIYSLVVLRGGIPEDKVIIQDIDNLLKQTAQYMGSGSADVIQIEGTNGRYQFIEYEDGSGAYKPKDNVGYTVIDFTYPTDEVLSCNAGDSITSVLDKIKSKLGNYEYFFDIHGIFHFQKIKNFIEEGNPQIDLTDALNNQYFVNTYSGEKAVYEFTDANLITAFTNSPQYEKIKNNIVIWGNTQKELANAYYYQVAIDTPPDPQGSTWYVILATKEQTLYGDYSYVTKASREDFEGAIALNPKDWRTELYLQSISDKKITYYSEKLIEEWPKIYDIVNNKYRTICTEKDGSTPSHTLTYYFDMIDPNKLKSIDLQSISIPHLGERPKVVSNENINCLFYPMPPNVCFIRTGEGERTAALRQECINKGWNYTQVYPLLHDKLHVGSGYNAAYDLARSMLHELIKYNENVSITALPIYHLEPNTRIKIKNKEAKIDGDYLIQSISLPLAAHSGTMTIQCTKAIEMI